MNKPILLILIPLILFLAPSCAETENPQVNPNLKLVTLLANGQELRFRSIEKGLKEAISEVSPGFDQAIPEFVPWVWRGFFAGASVLPVLAESDRPVTAFINPYVDAVVFAEWSEIGEDAKLIRISATSGQAFMDGRESSSEDLPRYAASPDRDVVIEGETLELPFPLHLVEDAKALISEIESRFPPFGSNRFKVGSDEGLRQGFNYLGKWTFTGVGELIRLEDGKRNPKVRQQIHDFRAAIGNLKLYEAMISPKVSVRPEHLAEIPEKVRKRMLTTFAISSEKTRFIFYSDPAFPVGFIAAQFAVDGGQSPQQVISGTIAN